MKHCKRISIEHSVRAAFVPVEFEWTCKKERLLRLLPGPVLLELSRLLQLKQTF